MIDLSEEPLEENIEICKTYLERMSKMGMTLEIELGVTGGEEDGVDNSDIDVSKLYTQPDEVAYAYEELSKVSTQFTVAAAFGNVHGVYKPGNVKLTPKILKNSQEFISEKFNVPENTVDFVFHGGSGSTHEEIRESIGYGVIKMNIDTDLQYAYTEGIRDYMVDNIDYLNSIRQNLRQQLLNSSLCDGINYAKNVEVAFRNMWKNWCKTGSYKGK